MFNPDILVRNLNTLLKQHDIKPYTLAKKTGLTRETVIKIVNGGSKNPMIKNLYAIADYFDCTLDELVGRGNVGKAVDISIKETLLEAALDILRKDIEEQEDDITLAEWCDDLKDIYANIDSVSSRTVEKKRKAKL